MLSLYYHVYDSYANRNLFVLPQLILWPQELWYSKESKALRIGSLKYLASDYNLIGYARFYQEEQIIVLVNNNQHEIIKEISIWECGVPKNCQMEQLLMTSADGYTTNKQLHEVKTGILHMILPKTSATILRHQND